MPKIYLTVTTDLTFDQRMIRICTSLAGAGYSIVLVGRIQKFSIPLSTKPFEQKRINCLFNKGKLFYAEYNIRLFFYLLFKKMDCICAIDLDTILPCLFISQIKNVKRVYDAHELFCEMKEIVTRQAIYKSWKKIERYAVPKFKLGYSVNEPIALEFKKMYGLNYQVIRNIAVLRILPPVVKKEKFILYQGAVNEARCFETLIPAMKQVNCLLIICGEGNFYAQAKKLVAENGLAEKVIFKGRIEPDALRLITRSAHVGITLFERQCLSNYYSLANRFFDYMHAGVPQLCVDFPLYNAINDKYQIALLANDTGEANISLLLNELMNDDILYKMLQQNCNNASNELNWQQEEKILIHFYKNIFE